MRLNKLITILFIIILLFFNQIYSKIILKQICNPEIFKIFENKICIYDSKCKKIDIFKINSGQRVFSFDKYGEGPGEFTNVETFQIYNNNIIVSTQNKLILYTLSTPKKFIEIKKMNQFELLKINDRRWIGEEIIAKGKKFIKGVFIYDNKLIRKNNLYVFNIQSALTNKIKIIEYCKKFLLSHDKIYIIDTEKSANIKVFDFNGNFFNTIKTELIENIEISKLWRNKKIKELKSTPIISKNWNFIKNKFYFPRYFPPFQNISVSKDNKILIKTYFQIHEKTKFIYFSNSKRKIIFLPQDIELFECSGSTIYYLQENEEGTFELIDLKLSE